MSQLLQNKDQLLAHQPYIYQLLSIIVHFTLSSSLALFLYEELLAFRWMKFSIRTSIKNMKYEILNNYEILDLNIN
jgi:hypothetical protein